MAQVLWREAYLKRQKRKEQAETELAEQEAAPCTSCNIWESIGAAQQRRPVDESTGEPTLRM